MVFPDPVRPMLWIGIEQGRELSGSDLVVGLLDVDLVVPLRVELGPHDHLRDLFMDGRSLVLLAHH